MPRQTHEEALERANRAAANEPLSREEARELIAESFALLWPEREFSDEDYEQLTDSVLRIRAARRALREVPVLTRTAEFIERQRRELTDALTRFEVVAGASPSELPDVLDPDSGLSPDEAENEEGRAENVDEVPELLSDYPRKR